MEKFLYESKIKKDPKLNAIFAFPAIENFAMSSIGYLSIFKTLDEMEDVFAERYYSNSKSTITPIQKVDIIGFSFSFEMDIFQIMKMLEKLKIPLLAKDRSEEHPIIFVGGPVSTSNPIPFEEFFDFFNVGDSNIPEVVRKIVENKEKTKKEKLKAIKDIKGIWVPQFGKEKTIERHIEEIKEPTATPILSDKSYFSNTYIIEVERGCPKMCKFCLASWHNLPFREGNLEKLKEKIEFALKHTNKIALLGAYVAGHKDFDDIMAFIREKNKISPIEISISSLRADLVTKETIETLVECKAKSATIAIEAGSEKLRKAINKDLTNEEIEATFECATKYGLKGLKVYMMVGLPDEDENDIKEIIELLKKLKKKHKTLDLSVSLNTLIPKPHTPYELIKRENKKSLEKKINYIKKHLHILGIKLNPISVEWDGVQSLISRYPKSLAEYLICVHKEGAKLGAFKSCWKNFAKKYNLKKYDEAIEFPFEDELDDNSKLPWDFIKINNLKEN